MANGRCLSVYVSSGGVKSGYKKEFLSVLVSAQNADGRHLVVVVVVLTDVSGEFGADVVVLTDEALANGGGNLQQKHTLILAEENINNSLF